MPSRSSWPRQVQQHKVKADDAKSQSSITIKTKEHNVSHLRSLIQCAAADFWRERSVSEYISWMICSQILFAWIWVLVRILQDWKRFFWPVLHKKYFVSPAPGSSMTISVGEHWSGEDGPWRLLTVCSGDTHTIANLLFLQRNALRGISISFLWDSHVSTPDQTQNLFTFAVFFPFSSLCLTSHMMCSCVISWRVNWSTLKQFWLGAGELRPSYPDQRPRDRAVSGFIFILTGTATASPLGGTTLLLYPSFCLTPLICSTS